MVLEEGENDQWWIPELKVADYFFQKSIDEIPDFHNLNRRDHIFDLEFSEEGSESYISLDENFQVTVENDIIQSLCCRSYFRVLNENVVGNSFEALMRSLEMRFNQKKITIQKDQFVLYDNGDMERDIDIPKFSIFATVDESGIIQSISAY